MSSDLHVVSTTEWCKHSKSLKKNIQINSHAKCQLNFSPVWVVPEDWLEAQTSSVWDLSSITFGYAFWGCVVLSIAENLEALWKIIWRLWAWRWRTTSVFLQIYLHPNSDNQLLQTQQIWLAPSWTEDLEEHKHKTLFSLLRLFLPL